MVFEVGFEECWSRVKVMGLLVRTFVAKLVAETASSVMDRDNSLRMHKATSQHALEAPTLLGGRL